MIDIKTETLQEALQTVGLRELPRAYDKNSMTVFLKAICLVKKSNGTEAYCLCENDGQNNPAITKVFGPSYMIMSVKEIYPYLSLDKKYKPDFRSDKQIAEFLRKNNMPEQEIQRLMSKDGKTDLQIKADQSEVKRLVMKYAIEYAKRAEIEHEHSEKLKAYANNKKGEKKQ